MDEVGFEPRSASLMPVHLAAALELSVKLHTPAFRVSARPPRCLRSLPLDKPAAVTLLNPCTDGRWADSAEPHLLYDGSGRESGSPRPVPAGVLSCGGEEEGESVAVRNGAGVPMLMLLACCPNAVSPSWPSLSRVIK